jgi:signal transduction histidine kinase
MPDVTAAERRQYLPKGKFGRRQNLAVVAVTFIVLISGFAPFCLADSQPHRILILQPYDNQLPATVRVADTIRTRLRTESPGTEVFEDFLDLARFPSDIDKARVAAFLSAKYSSQSIQVIVAPGIESLRFTLDHSAEIAPAARVVFCCVPPESLAELHLPGSVTGVLTEQSPEKTLGLARSLQPDAREVVVVTGADHFGRQFEATARRKLAPFEHELKIRFLASLTHQMVLEEVSRLPPTAIVIFAGYFRDGSGRTFVPTDVADEVTAASVAPVYAPYDAFMGHGIVGGYMETYASAGGATADLLQRILAGDPGDALPSPTTAPHAFRVDARQLERWHMSKVNLPATTIQPPAAPGILEQHSDSVLLTLAVVSLQACAIGALLIQTRRRVRVEKSLRASEARKAATEAQLIQTERQANELGTRLLTLREDERRRIAAELHDSTVQHLVAIDLTLHRMQKVPCRPDQLRACHDQIKQLLDQAQKELRLFAYLRYPPELRTYGLKTAVERFVSGFAERAGIVAQCHVDANIDDVPYLLQSSVLRVIQESLANVYRHSHASVVVIRLKLSRDTLRVHVRDNGRGIIGHSGQLPDGPYGAGIPAMRARLQDVGGRFRLFSGKGGTLIVGMIPIIPDATGTDSSYDSRLWDMHATPLIPV